MTHNTNNQFNIGGLNFDKHNALSDGSFYYLRNGDISDFTNSGSVSFAQNSPSNELCVEIPDNGNLVGHIKLDKNRLVLFTKTLTNNFIYLLNSDTCELSLITSGPCLNFSSYITGVYKYKGCELIIYFSDGVNPFRYLNLSDIPKTKIGDCDTCPQEFTSDLDCEALNIYKSITPPKIEVDVTEGNIPDGVYQFGISFGEENESFTEIFIYSKVFNLHQVYNQNNRFGFRIKFDCFDKSFDQYKLYLIANREDRGLVAQEIGTFENNSLVTITELDSTSYHPISNEELLSSKIYYQSAKHIATNGDHLVLADLTERNDFNYQLLANQIKSYVDIIKVPSKQAHLYPSYMSDEVYPFYIQWIYEDMQATPWTHIPSDAPFKNSYNNIVTNDDVWENDCVIEEKKEWEIYNKAELLELLEENDNGYEFIPSHTTSGECKTYKIKAQFAGGWPGILTYTSCDGYVVEEEGTPDELTFCTSDINSVNFIFSDFDTLRDIANKGKCNIAQPSSLNCTKLKISKFKTSVTGIFTWQECTPVIESGLWTEECHPLTFSVHSGELKDFEFCSCVSDFSGYPTGVDIEVDFSYTVEELSTCGSIVNVEQTKEGGLCDYKVVGTSTFAYWESSLKYPEKGFENLPNYVPCQTGIRYHRFPDRTQTLNGKHFPHIHSNTSVSNSKEYVYILAPRFENIQFPVDCNGKKIDKIIGYRIGVGDRANNKSIVHKGLIYNMREEMAESCDQTIYYANYPFNDLNPDSFIGSKELLRSKLGLSQGHTGTFVPMKNYSKEKFQYISPNIQFEKNDQNGTELITYCEENGYVSGSYQYTDEMPQSVILEDKVYTAIGVLFAAAITAELIPLTAGGADAFGFLAKIPETLRRFIDGKNYALNGTFISKLTKRNWNNITTGNRRRKLDTSFYMQPVKQQLENVKINNYQRESGLFLSLNKEIKDPFIVDRSRILYTDIDTKEFDELTQNKFRTSQYYVGIKRHLPSQYGNFTDPLIKPITDIIKDSKTNFIVSGDIYITKHTTYKKFPFFTNLPLNAPYDSSYILSSYLNVGFPRFWMDVENRNDIRDILFNSSSLGQIAGVFGVLPHSWWLEDVGVIKKSSCGKKTDTKKKLGIVDGHYYTHLVGVVSYYCESEYIGDYRETNEIPQSLYYPLKDISEYSKYEHIQYPEVFKYNYQQRFTGVISKYPAKNVECKEQCYSKNRIIFSLKQDTFSKADRWLNFPPNNFHQFNQQDGDFTTLFSIDNQNILFLFDNAAYLSQNDQGLLTTDGIAYLGQGSIFERKIRKISSEINGLGGCLDKYGVVNTPYGVFWPDRNRKTFVGYTGKGLTELNTNMKSWFNEFMNNPIKGHYDPFSRTIFWTGNFWTIGFKPELERFISFYDFIPDMYLPMDYNYLTYKSNKSNEVKNSIWKHNKKNHYQTFYNQTYPFEIGYTINNKLSQSVLQSLQVQTEFYKNQGFGKRVHTGEFFDKLFIYNDRVSTGVQELFLKDINDVNHSLIQPNFHSKIEVTSTEYDIFNINGFENFAQFGAYIEWELNGYKYNTINFDENIVNSNGTIRGKWFNTHLIASGTPEIKKQVQLSLNLHDSVK